MLQREGQLCFMLLFLHLSSSAQISVGLNAGFSSNYLNVEASNQISSVICSETGFKVGVPVQLEIDNRWFMEIELEILQKNYRNARVGSLKGVYSKATNTYSQLPLTIGFRWGRRLKRFINGGLYAGYWLSGRVEGRIPDIFSVSTDYSAQTERFRLVWYNKKYMFEHGRDRQFEVGCTGSMGVEFPLNWRFMFFLKGTYYCSWTDKQKPYLINQKPEYNQTFTFALGGRCAFRNQ